MLLDWLKERLCEYEAPEGARAGSESGPSQGLLFRSIPYREDAPAIRSPAELEGALEHLEYAVHRRFHNQLTRAERARLDNTIENALFKVDRYLDRLDPDERALDDARIEAIRQEVLEARERAERQKDQARRADLKLAQLGSLSAEGFEEFVAEMFEALGYEVERTGGTGDEGVDLRLRRAGLLGIVQCKYHSRGVVGSPDLQKFLGSIQHTRSHKGFFVSTRTFSLAAEKFAADHPIELIDGPRLVELVEQALGPGARKAREPAWF
jgi:restriction system protein